MLCNKDLYYRNKRKMTKDLKNTVSGFYITPFKQTKILFENKARKQQWLKTKACYVFRAMLITSCEKSLSSTLMSTRNISKHAK